MLYIVIYIYINIYIYVYLIYIYNTYIYARILHEHVAGHTESPYPEQGQGPHERPVRPREDLDVNGQWHQFLIDALCDAADVQDLEQRFYSHLQEQAISRTSLRRTLILFKDTLMEEDANLIGFDFDGVQALETLCRSDHWEFLQVLSPALVRNNLEELTEECHDIEAHLSSRTWRSCPVLFASTVMLHALSGRRLGDVQFYLDQLARQQTEYILHVVSVDIVVDKEKGNAMDPKTWDFWIAAIRQ